MALTTAYAGHGDITSENAGAILNQFLPEDPPKGVGLGLVLIPERVPRLMKGLKTVIAWLEGEVGADGTIPVPDLVEAMLKRKEAEGDDLELYLLFDPENEDDVALANAAHDAGIPVRNLAAAGDFLVFEEAPADEPETPPFDVDEPTAAEAAMAADARAEGVLAGEQAAADARSLELARQLVGGAGITINIHISPEGVRDLARAIVAEMASLGAAQVAAQSGPVASVVPIDSKSKAEPTGRTEQAPGTSAFYYHAANGSYRKARGMARDGETKVYLTDAEAAEARANKMLA